MLERRGKMIEVKGLTKHFNNVTAIDHIDANIKEGQVFGLIGTNGAGKSTFLKLACGILKPDEGSIIVDNEEVFENSRVKENIFYISDDQYYFPNVNADDMMTFYKEVYRNADKSMFDKLIKGFELPRNRKVNTFSKGMKKQLSIILGLSSRTKYLYCDETFDGLDPVVRQAVKSLLAECIEDRGLTPIIASHNLRELEDICDHVGLLHKGGILFSKDIDDMKLSIHKIQLIFPEHVSLEDIKNIDILHSRKLGSVYTLTVRGEKEEVEQKLKEYNLDFFEIIPLSLEEIFISETEVKGYDIKKLVF
jgi:hypothetical protein